MEIKRDIMAALLKWKQRPERKPLIIQGARQIGKTWIMRKFGEEYFDYVAGDSPIARNSHGPCRRGISPLSGLRRNACCSYCYA